MEVGIISLLPYSCYTTSLNYKGDHNELNITDMDTLHTTGIYYYNSSTGMPTIANMPPIYKPMYDNNWTFIIVIGSSGITHQYVLKPSYGVIAFREYSGAPAQWFDWKYIFDHKQPYVEISMATNTAFIDFNSMTIHVCGRIATVSGILRPKNTDVDQTACYIPDYTNPNGQYERYKPISNQWLSCDRYTGDGRTSECILGKDGRIRLSASVANGDYKISGVYITKG